MVKAFEVLEGGLVVPVPDPVDSRKYGPLEIVLADDRKETAKSLVRLLHLNSMGSGRIRLCDPQAAEARKSLILFVAGLLLGDDFSYDELC